MFFFICKPVHACVCCIYLECYAHTLQKHKCDSFLTTSCHERRHTYWRWNDIVVLFPSYRGRHVILHNGMPCRSASVWLFLAMCCVCVSVSYYDPCWHHIEWHEHTCIHKAHCSFHFIVWLWNSKCLQNLKLHTPQLWSHR